MLSVRLSTFVMCLSTLIPIINPFSGAMLFVALTSRLSEADRAYMAAHIAVYCAGILLVSLFMGHLILGFFGISVGVLRIAGGCVLFAAGWRALNAPSHDEDENKTAQPVKQYSRAKLKSMAFYPFSLPLTAGPGGISVSVALGSTLPYDLPNIAGSVLAIVATVIIIWLCYRYSDRVSKAMGATGADALARIMAFILVCLGVSVVWQGFVELWQTLP